MSCCGSSRIRRIASVIADLGPWAACAAGPCPWLWVVGGVVSYLEGLSRCPACADLGG